MSYFADYNQRFKKVCPNTVCPTNCQSMTYVHSKHRWCYDENYGLRSDQGERLRVNGKTSNIMTNIFNTIDESKRKDPENESYVFESNMVKYTELICNDSYTQAIVKVANAYNIQANSLIATLVKEIKKIWYLQKQDY